MQQYETRMGKASAGVGTGFGTPAPISLPLDSSKVTGTQSGEDAVAKSLGYNSYQEALATLTAPADDTTKFYNDAYTAAGLSDLSNKIAGRQNDLNNATGNINDNPWLDESSRLGRVKNVTTLATGDIKNLQDEYKTKLASVHDLVTQHSKDLQTTAAANKTKLTALEAQAKQLATEATTNQKAPSTISGPNGTKFQWNPQTQSFEPLNLGGAPGTTPPPISTKDAISGMSKELGTITGNDGYINPKDWQTAMNAWNGKGLSTASFISNFKKYANPNDTYTGLPKKK
jgi:hypothetical protein